jgi:hypothetical protein
VTSAGIGFKLVAHRLRSSSNLATKVSIKGSKASCYASEAESAHWNDELGFYQH